MTPLRVETTIAADGELHLKDLPLRSGDKVEAIVTVLEHSVQPASGNEREKARAAAVAQFLTLARTSTFRSTEPYPSRDELHERH